MRLLRNLLRLTLVSSLGFVSIGAMLLAAEPAQQVQLRIGSILASNQSKEFDSKLGKWKKQLEVFKYQSYKLIREDSQRAGWRTDATFEIPGGRSLIVAPQERRNNQLALKVRLVDREKTLVDTTVTLSEGGNFLLGGPPHEGGVLILSISASTN
jgi:hypothetical protein